MKLILCVDDKGGLAFNHRRQSRDRVLNERILMHCGMHTIAALSAMVEGQAAFIIHT